MSENGLVSVVIPVRNGEQFLEQTLRSILSQQYEPLEIWIVDDGSTDRTRELALSFPAPIRYVYEELGSPSLARNVALGQAKGDFVAFLDADDLWTSGHLCHLTAALAADPGAGFAQGRIRNFRWSPKEAASYCSPVYRFCILSCAVYRRAVFEQAGLLDGTLRFGEDTDFHIRCWEQGIRKAAVKEVSLLYRRHGGNMTARKSLQELGIVQVFKRRRDRIQSGLVDLELPRSEPLKTFLGEPPTAYDDGRQEPLEDGILVE
ncbi:MAG: glycosyltransferase family A protein [Acidobacteria bacterium]|nr:glycosyltransferase family A protein [Acidobacteriota bacterium]